MGDITFVVWKRENSVETEHDWVLSTESGSASSQTRVNRSHEAPAFFDRAEWENRSDIMQNQHP